MKRLALAALCVCLSGCLGYHIGEVKPFYLKDVKDIAVPTFKNDTLIPHIDSLVTDTVIKQFQQDGTYKIVNESGADAILKAEITRITRSPARSLVGNVLATTEFNLSMHVRYRLVGRNGEQLSPTQEAAGTTSFFVSTDVTTDERQALPLATEELAIQLVRQLSEGW